MPSGSNAERTVELIAARDEPAGSFTYVRKQRGCDVSLRPMGPRRTNEAMESIAAAVSEFVVTAAHIQGGARTHIDQTVYASMQAGLCP
jgi:hypothetical protein